MQKGIEGYMWNVTTSTWGRWGIILKRASDRGYEWLKESWDRSREVYVCEMSLGLYWARINISSQSRDQCEIAKVCHCNFHCCHPTPLGCEIFTRYQMKTFAVTGQFVGALTHKNIWSRLLKLIKALTMIKMMWPKKSKSYIDWINVPWSVRSWRKPWQHLFLFLVW